MGLIVSLFNLLNVHIIIKLFLQVMIGGVFYIFGAKLLKLDSFEFLTNIIKGLIVKKTKHNNKLC